MASENDDAGKAEKARQEQAEAREKRLAAALRDNLRRRKAQVRARTSGALQATAARAGATGPGGAEPPSTDKEPGEPGKR